MDANQDSIITKRRLPHYYTPNATVFITWNLDFHFPQSIINELEEQKKLFEQQNSKLTGDYRKLQEYQQDKKRFDLRDRLLGLDHSLPALLKHQRFAQIVASSLHYWHDDRYNLHCYCIMPNHVHVLCTPLGQEASVKDISKITYSIKRFTSNQINKLRGTKGSVWQSESYDHVVRSPEEMGRIINYILINPVEAGLVTDWMDWPYSWIDEMLIERANSENGL